MEPHRPWLVADIGGTNARFGLVEQPGAAPIRVRVLAGRDYPGPVEAALDYLGDVRPAAACLAVAGPVTEGRFWMSNLPWAGSADQIRAALGLDHVELINDFEALALSLPYLAASDLRPIGPVQPLIHAGATSGTGVSGGTVAGQAGRAAGSVGPLAVLGPGTGLGAALLVPTAQGWTPISGEGGHADLAALDDREAEVMRLLRAEQGSGGAELLLSGAGLARLHRLLGLIHGVPAEQLTAADICDRRDDSLCAETLRTFCGLLGTFAGNAALTMGARGGVYLGGGILPRIADVLVASDFRHRFQSKPPVQDYLREIPTVLIVAATPALAGAAARLRQTLDRPREHV